MLPVQVNGRSGAQQKPLARIHDESARYYEWLNTIPLALERLVAARISLRRLRWLSLLVLALVLVPLLLLLLRRQFVDYAGEPRPGENGCAAGSA